MRIIQSDSSVRHARELKKENSKLAVNNEKLMQDNDRLKEESENWKEKYEKLLAAQSNAD